MKKFLVLMVLFVFLTGMCLASNIGKVVEEDGNFSYVNETGRKTLLCRSFGRGVAEGAKLMRDRIGFTYVIMKYDDENFCQRLFFIVDRKGSLYYKFDPTIERELENKEFAKYLSKNGVKINYLLGNYLCVTGVFIIESRLYEYRVEFFRKVNTCWYQIAYRYVDHTKLKPKLNLNKTKTMYIQGKTSPDNFGSIKFVQTRI